MPEPEQNTQKAVEEKQETQTQEAQAPARELTQTDHLNKKLLTSLFNRMNEGGDSVLAKMLEPDNDEETEEEWKD